MSSLADSFRELSSAQVPKHLEPQEKKPQVPRRLEPQARAIDADKVTKSTHPDYEPVKVFLRKDTRKLAWRKWEDAERGDFSDLVQELLEQYLRT